MDAIKVNNLTKYYGKHMGIENLSFSVKEGEVYGFIGPNGAGKSTTIRTLLGFLKPTNGSAEIFGMDISDTVKIKEIVGYIPSEVNFYNEMTVKDYINYSNSFYKEVDLELMNELIEILELDTTRKVRNLSFGNKRKVAIILAMVHRPKLLILDEPTSGLDPVMQHRFFDLLKKLNESGTTIFLSTHILSEVQKVCSKVSIIKNGSIIVTESVEDLNRMSMKLVNVKTKKSIDPKALETLGATSIEKSGNYYNFHAAGDLNKIFEYLLTLEIKDINISEPTIEDIFMEYYE